MNGNTPSPMPQGSAPQIPSQAPVSMLPQPKSNVWMWVILVAVALAVFGVVIYYILLPEEVLSPAAVKREESIL